MYSVRGKDGEQNGTICSGTYLGREKGIFLDQGSPELADGAAPVKISDAFDQSKPFTDAAPAHHNGASVSFGFTWNI